ncbi:MAG: hypothetical protein Q8M83_06475 [bacterium]|nr:hypothetical protein [bacterium]
MKKYFFSTVAIGLVGISAAIGNLSQIKKINLTIPEIMDGASYVDEVKQDKPATVKAVTLPGFDGTQINAEDMEKFKIDSDKDGLPNYLEPFYGTDPANPDTDKDGFKDGEEVDKGYNPAGEGEL